jgi:hypothetical protein
MRKEGGVMFIKVPAKFEMLLLNARIEELENTIRKLIAVASPFLKSCVLDGTCEPLNDNELNLVVDAKYELENAILYARKQIEGEVV